MPLNFTLRITSYVLFTPLDQNLMLADKLRPDRRRSQAVLYAEWVVDHWQPLKLD